MKLHLPKILLTALLSACSCAYALSGWGSGTNNYCLDIDGGTTTSIDASNREFIRFNADMNSGTDEGCNMTATVEELKMKDNSTIIVRESSWNDSRHFSLLTIEDVQVANQGTTHVEVHANNGLAIGAVSGALGNVVNDGTLTLGTDGGTLLLNGTLNNRGTMTVKGSLQLTRDLRNFEGKYVESSFSNAATGNGYGTFSGTFYLAMGAELSQLTVTQEGKSAPIELDTTTDSGNTLFTSSYTTEEYWVNKGTVTIGGDNGEINTSTNIILNGGTASLQDDYKLSQIEYRSGGIHIAEGTTLNANAALSKDIITSLTGDGTLNITQTNTIQGGNQLSLTEATTTTAFRGNISVQSGATLKIGDASELMLNWSVNMDSLKSLDLDGGSIRFFGANSSLSVLNVNTASSINSWQAGRNEVSGLHIGTVNLNDNLDLWGDWGSVFEVDELNGTGDLELSHNAKGNTTFTLTIGDTNSVGTITTRSYTILNLGSGDDSTHFIDNTMTIGGQLTVKGHVTLNSDLRGYDLYQRGEVSSYSDNGNGYAYSIGSKYYFARMAGGNVTNTEEELQAIHKDFLLTDTGDIVFQVAGSWDNVYHLNTKSMTVGGSNGEATANAALGFTVAEGHTLTIAGAVTNLTTGEMLINTSGAGNVNIATYTYLDRAQKTRATGTLTISNGAELHVRSAPAVDLDGGSIDTFSKVVLDTGRLRISEGPSNLKVVEVTEKGGTITLNSTGPSDKLSVSDTMTLNGRLVLENVWIAKVDVNKVTGTGDMQITSWGNAYGQIMNVSINKLENYTGDVLFQSNIPTYAATLHIGSVGSMGSLTNFGAATLISLGDDANSVHNLSHTMTIRGQLTMQGKVNLVGDMTTFQLRELGTISKWSDGQDGYATTTGSTLVLVDLADGGTMNNTAEELASMNSSLRFDTDGDVVFTAGTFQGATYYLRTKDITVGGADGHAAATSARQLDVAEGRTLTITGDIDNLTAAQMVVSTTGKGNLTLRTGGDVILANHDVSQAEGTLRLEGKTRLKTGSHQDNVCFLNSFSKLVLDDSELYIFSNNPVINNLEVTSNGGTVYTEDIRNEGRGAIHFAGTTQLDGDLLLGCWYNAQYQMDELAGTGHINIDPYINGSSKLVLDVLSADSWTGQLNIDMKEQSLDRIDIVMADDWAGTVNLSNAASGGINLAALGAKATINMADNELYLKVDTALESNIASALKLSGNTKIINGYDGAAYHFNGAVSGTGNLEVAAGGLQDKMDFNFKGSVSDWSGHATVSAGHHALNFSAGATAINLAQISADGTATLDLNITNTQDVEVSSAITMAEGATLNLTVTNSGDTTFTADVLASLISTNGTGCTQFLGSVEASSIELNAATLFGGSVTGNVTAQAVASLVLGHAPLTITGDLTASASALDLSGLVLSMPLSESGDAPLTITLVTTTGSMDIEGIESIDPATLGVNYDPSAFLLALEVQSLAGQGNKLVLSISQVPEPATATLGLLALTALAARRRRK